MVFDLKIQSVNIIISSVYDVIFKKGQKTKQYRLSLASFVSLLIEIYN